MYKSFSMERFQRHIDNPLILLILLILSNNSPLLNQFLTVPEPATDQLPIQVVNNWIVRARYTFNSHMA